MSNHQEHFGKKFYLDKKTGYWICTSNQKPRYRAHQWVWINIHGLIPKGYHIHHINDDKADNRIENLELIKASRHLSHHMTVERRKKAAEHCDKIRSLTKIWHKSPEGKTWHKLHAIKSKFGKWEKQKYICLLCKKQYETSKRSGSKFCSNNCKSKWRRDQGLDNICKNCQNCNNSFNVNKYSKQIFCSRSCSIYFFWNHKNDK